jgi:NDP-sugar pyrophosphorylase family protein
MGDVRPVILAGGTASRFGHVTRILPKCLLPISASETLLTRCLNHLRAADFDNVIISTSPEQYPILDIALRRYVAGAALSIELLSNETHALGPLAALRRVLEQVIEPFVLLALSDIAFTGNPFVGLTPPRNLLMGCQPARMATPSSGFLLVRDGVVNDLSYSSLVGDDCAYWPGVAMFERSLVLPYLDRAASVRAPLETVFEMAIRDGAGFEWTECPAFVNVNTPADWRACLSTTD